MQETVGRFVGSYTDELLYLCDVSMLVYVATSVVTSFYILPLSFLYHSETLHMSVFFICLVSFRTQLGIIYHSINVLSKCLAIKTIQAR